MGFKGFKVYLLGGKEYFEIKDHVSNESCWVNSKGVYLSGYVVVIPVFGT